MGWLDDILNGVINGLRGSLASFGDVEFTVYRGGTNFISDMLRKPMPDVENPYEVLQSLMSGSETKIFTFHDFERRTTARTASHDLINRATLLEYIGEDLEKLTFDIKLVRSLGVDIEAETERIREYVKEGHADFFVLGGEVLGNYQWVITNMRERLEVVDTFGRVQVSELELTLESYDEIVDTS